MLLKIFVAAGVWLAVLQITDIVVWGYKRVSGRKEADPTVKKIRWGLAVLLALVAALAFHRSTLEIKNWILYGFGKADPEQPQMLKIARMAVIYLAVFKFGDLAAKFYEWLCRKTDPHMTLEYRMHNKTVRWVITAMLLICVSIIATLGFFGILFALIGFAVLALFLK
ncbi:hypothetical protein AALA00_13535 [Lachnospiraceae bacterium 46-15]